MKLVIHSEGVTGMLFFSVVALIVEALASACDKLSIPEDRMMSVVSATCW